MRQSTLLVLVISLSLVLADYTPVAQAAAGGISRFTTSPTGAPGHLEGLTADPQGNIYAASFELTQVSNLPAPQGPFPRRRKGPQGDPLPPFQHNYIYTFAA